LILKLARKAGIKVKVADFKVLALKGADEVFITNAPRKIIPVAKADGARVGGVVDGRAGAVCPGPVTKKIMQLFDEYVQKQTGR
jgi:branched-subunit amino acid aminotransferase/4-amino-4-deoxychorismate lyase